VRKVVESAKAEGFLDMQVEGGQAIRVLPPLVDLFEDSLALQLAFCAHCASIATRG